MRSKDSSKACRSGCGDMDAPPFPVDLCDVLIDRTWLVRVVGPLAFSLEANGEYEKLERAMASFLQNRQRGTGLKYVHDDQSAEGTGTTVHFCWGECEPGKENNQAADPTGECDDGIARCRKRRKLEEREILTDEVKKSSRKSKEQHLVIDVRVQEESAAQLVCCYPQFTRNRDYEKDGPLKIGGFDFLLTRGSQSFVDGILVFLGGRTAGSVFRPSVADVTRSATLWTTQHWKLASRHSNRSTNGNSSQTVPIQATQNDRDQPTTVDADNNVTSNMEATKPLTLTFEVPSGPAGNAGLDTISLTVPPVALLRLCNKIMASESKSSSLRRNCAGHIPNKKKAIPIVSALQCCLRDIFHVRIEKFSLIRALCSAAVLGCDGRCKPLCAPLLHLILCEIRLMTAA